MCSLSCNVQNNVYRPGFKRRENNTVSSADKFIHELEKQERKQNNGDYFKRNLGTTTGSIPFYLSCAYSLFTIFKTKKLKKTLPPKDFEKLQTKYLKNNCLGFVGAVLACLGINKFLNSQTEENYTNINKKFNSLNKNTNAKLSDRMLYSNYMGAFYNPISGVIQLNKNLVNDPIDRRKAEKLIKHELVHAKQYETVARSENGIRKINYTVINDIRKQAIKNPNIKIAFEDIYHDIEQNREKYKGTSIRLLGGSAKVNLEKYIEAIHILLNNPNADIDDIPMVIDEQHYQNVVNKKGKLTSEEEKKADLYYKAMLDYSPISAISALNPFSSYRQNILEKEAYKENPTLMTRISNLL